MDDAAEGDEVMLMHPRMDRLQAYGAGELTGEPKRSTAAHIAQCPRCRATVDWIHDVRSTIRVEAPEPPANSWAQIAARVQARDAVLLPVEESAPERGATVRALRVAAITLLIAAGAAASVPREWLRTVADAVLPASWFDGPEDAPANEPAQTDAPAGPVILLVEPAAGALRIALERPRDGVRIHVRMVDASELEVRATGGAAAATFRTSPGRIEIAGADSGAVMLALPRGVASVRIDVDGTPYLLKERGRVRIMAPTADTIGAEYILPVRAGSNRSQQEP
jgi:hypothetical protein